MAKRETSDLDRELEILEAEMKRLEAEYNMFFAGRLPRPPWETRSRVEKMITLAKRGDLAARRAVVAQFPNEPLVVNKLFDEIAPKYADRTSGYTRIVRIGQRRGDAAEIVQIELV